MRFNGTCAIKVNTAGILRSSLAHFHLKKSESPCKDFYCKDADHIVKTIINRVNAKSDGNM